MRPFCDDCGAPVLWAVTAANSKWIALNPDPDPDGNQAAYRDHVQTLRTRQIGSGEQPVGFERRYMPHVATCPKRKPAQLPPNVIPISRAASRRTTR